ncbi:MAG: hypothetical protein KDI75_11380 [Xanthomonadales bacterium]|nr:hypothetical protein [Xanthomonadales bacterium]
MHSSISSSERITCRARLGRVWLAAIILAVLALVMIDHFWRSRGFLPEVVDSRQLWAQERSRVDESGAMPVVFIGASRSAYGIDLDTWRTAFPATRPVMLSVNGHHPMATLRDLASDETFRGLVICDVDTDGLRPTYFDMQKPWVDYFHQQWTPNWRLHRLLLTGWQQLSVLGMPDLGWRPVLERWHAGQSATLPVAWIDSRRNGRIRFSRIGDLAAYGQWFINIAREKLEAGGPTPDQWLADLDVVTTWVHAIQSRGGKVVFFRPPVAEALRSIEAEQYDDRLYWDAFGRVSGIHLLDGFDVPQMQGLDFPDFSHVAAEDRARLTLALGDALLVSGLLDPDRHVAR